MPGVATALAIYESGAGYPVAAISSNNVEGVAKWLEGKERVKVVFVPDRLLNVVVK